MKGSDPRTLLDRTGRETINLLRYSKIVNDDLYTKWKFLADFVEKAKLQKRKMMGGHEDAKVPSKKARHGYEEMGDSSSAESDDSDDSDDSSSSSSEEC